MVDSPTSQSSLQASVLWRVSLGLLLLCSLATWGGAASGSASGAERPLFLDQTEQLAWAVGFDKLGVRPTLRKSGSHAAPDDDDADKEGSDGSGLAIAPALALSDSSRSTGSLRSLSSPHFSSQLRHLLPAPRAPPKA